MGCVRKKAKGLKAERRSARKASTAGPASAFKQKNSSALEKGAFRLRNPVGGVASTTSPRGNLYGATAFAGRYAQQGISPISWITTPSHYHGDWQPPARFAQSLSSHDNAQSIPTSKAKNRYQPAPTNCQNQRTHHPHCQGAIP